LFYDDRIFLIKKYHLLIRSYWYLTFV